MENAAALSIALIGLTALVCQWLAWKSRLPAILFLLLAGLLLGPGMSWLHPDDLFGELLFPLVSLSVAVVLFEGSMTLSFREIGSLQHVVRRLVTVGAAVTWAVVAVATHYIFNLGWELSILFGALMVVTGPTVIIPLLRSVRPVARVSHLLKWEGIVIDPIGALLVVVVYEFIVTRAEVSAFGQSLWLFVQIIATGTSLGALAGYCLGHILCRHLLPEYLQNLATLSLVLGVFTLANELAHESGLLAVTVMGIWLANMPGVQIRNILSFKEHLSVLLISGLFIILAARLSWEQLLALVGLGPLMLLVVVQFVARPLAVLASTYGADLRWQEKALLSWIAPRGIVAAAVSALFAIRLTAAGYPEAQLLVTLTFSVILGTVVFQSATSRFLARALGVAEPEPRGYLVIGANIVARTIANALKAQDVPVLLCDSNWDNIRAARMLGLETFYGNPVSEYADQNLDLIGIGKLLALSPQHEINVIASMRYRSEFGANNTYALLSRTDMATSEKHQIAAQHRGYTLFGEDVTYSKLASLISTGAEVRKTKLTEEFDFERYLQANASEAIPLFAIGPKGQTEAFVAGGKFVPGQGWVVLSLIKEASSKTSDKKKVRKQDSAKEGASS
jgi:NhaP-type Na+/H+ or K+/H+ antiporter